MDLNPRARFILTSVALVKRPVHKQITLKDWQFVKFKTKKALFVQYPLIQFGSGSFCGDGCT